MGVHEALVARLIAAAPILALLADARSCAWFERPRDMRLPAIVLTPVLPGQEWRVADLDLLERPSVQFDAGAADKTRCLALGNAIRAEMQRTDNVAAAGRLFRPPGIVEREFMDKEDPAGTEGVFRWMQEISFFHQPA